MKKLLLVLLIFSTQGNKANTIIVNVQDFQFVPNNFTANVGDVIRWVWVNAVNSHTTTSTTVPPGANSWNAPIDGANTQFEYTVAVSGTYTYRCIPHAPFGMVATFTVNAAGPTPVKLSAFTVKAFKKGASVLNWQTQTEDNADYFSVQRSENGKDFIEVGRTRAIGNSATAQNYSFVDDQLNQSTRYYYYQLLTVDLDKKQERSKIILYKQDGNNKHIIVHLSPNPVKSGDHIQLWFNAERDDKLDASVYDISGKLVYTVRLSAYTGVNSGHLHVHDLQAGAYLLKLSIGKLKETVRVTVQ